MPTSRQMIFIGFPAIILLLIFSGFLFIKNGAEKKRKQMRQETAKEVKQVVDYAENSIKNAYDNHKARQKRELALKKNAAAIIAEKSALILSNAIRENAENIEAESNREMTGLEHILSSLIGKKSSFKTADTPVSVILEKEKELKKYIKGSKTLLSINSPSGNLLWQNRMPTPSTTYIEPVTAKAQFNWNGKKTYWNVSVYLPQDNLNNHMEINSLKSALNNDIQLKKSLKEGYTLAITDFNGKILATLPEGAFPIKNTNNLILENWHEIDKGVYDRQRMRFLAGRQSESLPNAAILAQAITFEQSTLDWLTGQISESPELFIPPAAVLLIAIGIIIISFNRANSRSYSSGNKSKVSQKPEIKLIRKGNREIPDDVDVILTEVGSNGNKVEVKALHGVKYPEPDRESNLRRLRDIYFQGREVTNLDKVVRSDVLRGLLHQVGRRNNQSEENTGVK